MSEKREGNVFRVIVKAVVARHLLEEDLSGIGFSLGLASSQRILIMIGEVNEVSDTQSFWWRHDDGPATGITPKAFAAELGDTNFNVIDPLDPPYKNGIFDSDLLRYSLGSDEIEGMGSYLWCRLTYCRRDYYKLSWRFSYSF